MWFQKLLPDLKDKQASNCETGRGKSPAQLLLHTHTHTHIVMKDVHGCPLTVAVWTPLVCLTLVLCTHLHTYTHTHTFVQRETNGKKFLFLKERAMSMGPS